MRVHEPGHGGAGELPRDKDVGHRRESSPVVAIHAGAGALPPELRERSGEVEAVLRGVLDRARVSLERGEDGVTVAVAAVAAMEDFPLFNAGVGAALCDDGTVELSAAVMRGSDRAAGAVAGVARVRSPIAAAERVLHSSQVLLIGAAAEGYAAGHGLETCPPETFITDRQRARLAARVREDHGTVGAVCLDAHGVLAAATSTGGIMGQPAGRVGDSPIVGAGTWADGKVAVSCTGDGEEFIRAGVGRAIGAWVDADVPLAEACDWGLAGVRKLGGTGGLIAVAADGSFALRRTTTAMPRGVWRAGSEPEVWVIPAASTAE